jgi:AmmeMemoRadiSam system protein B
MALALDPAFRPPRLRSTLAAEPDGDQILIHDPHRVGQPIRVTPLGLEIVKHFSGEFTLAQIQESVIRITGGYKVELQVLANLTATLEESLLLDTPRFRERIGGPIRQPSCIGSYHADPKKLRAQLRELFTAPGGPGEAGETSGGDLRAVLVPHMDYGRGNITYGHGFKELIENTDATVFVIVATSHYSHHRLTLSRQHFATPLGIAETDQTYIERIVAEYGNGLFDDELAHLPEHSIELEVVLLQYLLEKRRPFKIVPLLVGSFGDCVRSDTDPGRKRDIAKMVKALRAAEAGCTEKVCYVISGDLAHIGPKFGDEQRAEGPWLEASRTQDEAILTRLNGADPAGYFETIAGEADARRICGLPPTWLTLATIQPKRGKVLHYQQFVHPQGHESVSFAAAAFYS